MVVIIAITITSRFQTYQLIPAISSNFQPFQAISSNFKPIPAISGWHLFFNITEKGQMIVPDWYNRILDYTRKYGFDCVFQLK